MVSLYQKVIEAAQRIKPYVYETCLEESPILSHQTNTTVYLKSEHLQRSGSFKFRGALNKILSLNPEQRSKGVIAASTGNHGIAVAMAAKIAKMKATIYLPEKTPFMKLSLIDTLGAEIIKCAGDCLQAEIQARQVSLMEQKTFISPYNDIDVIAGQGVIGVELYEQFQSLARPLDVVFISVGGGGLISGVASYLKQKSPTTRVIGCWPENAPVMYECLKEGKIIEVSEKSTLSEATAGGLEPGTITFEFCQEFIDDFVLVSEEEIKQSLRLIATQERFIIEGAAGVAVAGFLKTFHQYKGMNVAILLCGRNIDFEKYLFIFNEK